VPRHHAGFRNSCCHPPQLLYYNPLPVGKKQRIQRDRAAVLGRIQVLYDRIPAIPDCDGRCWRSCGPVDMSDAERRRIERAGVRISRPEEAARFIETYYCEALTGDKRCAVYEMKRSPAGEATGGRPLICRLWGATEGMRCPFGCVPEGGWLSDAEAQEMIAGSLRTGGHPAARRLPAPGQIREMAGTPLFKAIVAAANQSCQAGFGLRDAEAVPAGFRRQPRPGDQ